MTRVRLVALFRWKLVDCSSQTCAPSTLSGEQVQVLDRLLNLASSEAEFQPSRYYCSDHCTMASSLSLTPHSPEYYIVVETLDLTGEQSGHFPEHPKYRFFFPLCSHVGYRRGKKSTKWAMLGPHGSPVFLAGGHSRVEKIEEESDEEKKIESLAYWREQVPHRYTRTRK